MVTASLDAQAGAAGKAELQQRLQRMGECVRVLLMGLGEDISREGLRDTPQVRRLSLTAALHANTARQTIHSNLECALQRVAKALLDMTAGYREDPARCVCPAIRCLGARSELQPSIRRIHCPWNACWKA